jgi:hypothetical protein
MKESTYDPCLLYTNKNGFGVVSLQTDDTLFLADKSFAEAEEPELNKANFLAKARKQLTSTTPIKFNAGRSSFKTTLFCLLRNVSVRIETSSSQVNQSH